MLFEEIVDTRAHGRTMDDGQWAITKAHLGTLCSGELKMSTGWSKKKEAKSHYQT